MNEVEKNLSGERALDFIKLSFELKSSKLYKEAIEMLYKALSCPDIGDGRCEIMSQIAHLYFKLKNIDRAIEQYERALDIDEHHEASLLGLSDVYFSLADYDKALEIMEKLCHDKPSESNYVFYFKILFELKKYAKIQAVWNDLKAEYKENEELMYVLSKTLADDKKNILIELLEKNPENKLALLDYAEIVIEENNFKLALELLLKAKKIKEDFAVEFRLGYVYFNLAEYQKAIEAYLRALEFNPTSDRVYFELASAYIENFWYDEALIAVSRSIELADNIEDVDSRRLLYAWLNYKIGKSDKAKALLDSFNESSKLYEDAKILKYVILYSEGDVIISKLQLEILLRSNPENPLIISTLGRIYKQMQYETRAIEIYQKGLTISPNSIEFMSELTDLYIDKNEYEKAWELIEKLENINTKILPTYNSKARIYYRKKEYEKAYLELKKYIDLDKNNAEVYYFAGLILNDDNKPELAIEHLETAIRLSPEIGKYYSQIAKSYEIMGKMEIAMTWAKEACIVSGNDPLFLERAYELAQNANFEEDIRSFEVRLKYFKNNSNKAI